MCWWCYFCFDFIAGSVDAFCIDDFPLSASFVCFASDNKEVNIIIFYNVLFYTESSCKCSFEQTFFVNSDRILHETEQLTSFRICSSIFSRIKERQTKQKKNIHNGFFFDRSQTHKSKRYLFSMVCLLFSPLNRFLSVIYSGSIGNVLFLFFNFTCVCVCHKHIPDNN